MASDNRQHDGAYRRRVIESLDTWVTLVVEDGEKVVYVRCMVACDVLSIESSSTHEHDGGHHLQVAGVVVWSLAGYYVLHGVSLLHSVIAGFAGLESIVSRKGAKNAKIRRKMV